MTMTDSGAEDILFVGDIQGCSEPLERLLRAADYSPDRHRLIPLGDTINRGPDNLGVLQLLRSLGAEPILGNHETKLLEVVDAGQEAAWLTRRSRPHDLLGSPQRQAWIDWIRQWPHWRRGRGWIAVHGGLHPVLPPQDTPRAFLVTARACDARGNFPPDWDGHRETIPAGFRPWYDFYAGADIVAYGHWARQGLHRTHNTRGLDSGCVYGEALSAWWLRSDTIVQVSGQQR
ncbi:MAG: metallophosphoesterase, partial [Deltaproteobacteria bacterium]|nr:metallophosphoesterase [Deltaproteobacteria bacterium]